jgi:hypothetical protein
MHDAGRLKFHDGSTYEGEFKRGFPHGRGIYENILIIYQGEFYEGKFEGEGSLKYRSG